MIIGVCDDEKVFRNELVHLLKKNEEGWNRTNLVYEYISGEQLLLDEKKLDILFLDIHMSGMNGIEVAKQYGRKWGETLIVFASSDKNYLPRGYTARAFRFIVKPIDEIEFRQIMFDAQEEINSFKKIRIKEAGEIIIISIKDIIYIEADNRNCIIRTKDSAYLQVAKISDYEKLLDSKSFYRTHKSYIVNLSYIDSFNTKFIQLQNQEKIKIGIRKYKDFDKAFREFLWCYGR